MRVDRKRGHQGPYEIGLEEDLEGWKIGRLAGERLFDCSRGYPNRSAQTENVVSTSMSNSATGAGEGPVFAMFRIRHAMCDAISAVCSHSCCGFCFPQIAAIVLSGEFIVNVETSGLLMNAFFQKGYYTPQQLIATMRELYSQSPIRPRLPKTSHAPLWITRRSNEYLLATCTECLRSFPIDKDEAAGEGLQTAECPSCGTTIRYAVDSNVLKMLGAYKSAAESA